MNTKLFQNQLDGHSSCLPAAPPVGLSRRDSAKAAGAEVIVLGSNREGAEQVVDERRQGAAAAVITREGRTI
jgi:hypothetical protein